MNILVVGKTGSIVHWPENVLDGCIAAGCRADVWSITGQGPLDRARLKLARLRGRHPYFQSLADGLAEAVRRRRPDLILFVSAFLLPEPLFAAAQSAAPQVPLAGWVGDRFDAGKLNIARRLHRVFYTDSAFVEEARRLGFPDHGSWLPLAANERLFRPPADDRTATRDDRLVFVANGTPWRVSVLREMKRPVTVYGRSWPALRGGIHPIHGGRFPMRRLPGLYARSRAVLNIRNEHNVLGGLNQRSFEPLACGTPVLNDDLPDLTRCFTPGEDILVWRDVAELEELDERLSRDKGFARRIGAAGQRRVLAEHTFGRRIRTILDSFHLKP